MRFAYYSHHKCATGWTNSVVREVCFHTGWNHHTFHGGKEFLNEKVGREIDFLSYTNASPERVSGLPSHKGFHVIRDPRDIIVSAYHSHLYTHSTDNNWDSIEGRRQELKKLDKEAGLMSALHFAKGTLTQMYEWDYDQEHILETKMEELTASPSESFRRILAHLELPVQSSGPVQWMLQRLNRILYTLNHRSGDIVPTHLRKKTCVHPSIFEKIMAWHEFEKVKKRDLKRRDGEKSHYRKGKSGDWRDHFTDRVANEFDREYRGIVSKLGYE